MNKEQYFFKDKPLFGLDIGFSSIKVMELDTAQKQYFIKGYGVKSFDAAAIVDGEIIKPEVLAKAAVELFANNIVGEISTRRVALSIPASRTYNRNVNLPILAEKDIGDALRLEAEQYIPVPADDLYMDYQVISKNDKQMEVLAVAAPKRIIDSYMIFARLLGLEPVVLETTIGAASRLFVHTDRAATGPTILIDFGSLSSDITIYDNTVIVTGTVPGGGDSFTNLIAESLSISKQEGHIVKTKYGLGLSKKQKEITDALNPLLMQISKEIRRMIRYYEERSGSNQKVMQVVTMGGGANMPGLAEYLTEALRLPVRTCNPWERLSFDKLQPPNAVEKSMYVTVAGLSLLKPKEIFSS